ncbi:MAG: Na+/H+ antiporter NhaA [Gemmatimonadaceae bacterium]
MLDAAASPRLPTGRPLVERALAPFRRFAATEAAGGVVLLACTVVALIWANSPWGATYERLWEQRVILAAGPLAVNATLHQVINDGLMAIFFFLVGLEIKREILAGELASLRKSALPVAGAVGGMLVPALIYFALNAGGPGAHGWGVPMATDIAFAIGVLALLGDRVPISLKVFLTALAIADDIGAVLVIAAFYSSGIAWGALGIAALLLLVSIGANAARVRAPWVYALIGVALWIAVVASGVHGTVAGVLLALTIPVHTRVNETEFLDQGRRALDDFDGSLECPSPGLSVTVLTNEASQDALHRLEELCEQAQPPLHRLEHALHGLVAFCIMPLFALANAGVHLSGDIGAALVSPVTLGIVLGLVLGKPIGITLVSWLAVRASIADKPTDASWRMLHSVSWLGGIGFTMSLFVAGLAFPGTEGAPLLADAKVGILAASVVAGIVGWLILRRVGQSTASAMEGATAEPSGVAA